MATKKAKASKSGELAKVEQVDKHFRKTNEAIGLRVKEGKLTLLTRKVFNVMMYHAQEIKTPGLNAPIDTPASKKYFWIPLSDLARDAAYDSKDTEFLKAQLEELQNIKLLMENERQWTSERLVSSVTLVNPKGLNKHSGQVWFGYAFPPEVHELVMAPGTYTKLSIFYQGLLRSGAALALYEVCRRYATNPSRVTSQESYEHWYGVLTGNPVSSDELPPYKYFKRDVLNRAITEINTLTDIQIELIEHKNGRRVEQLQFRVDQAKQPQLEFPSPPVIDVQLMGRIIKLGLTAQDASDMVAQHGDAKIRESVAFVEARMAQKNSAPVDSPPALLRWTLKDGTEAVKAMTLATSKDSPVKATRKSAGGETIMEQFLSARAKEALNVYRDLDDESRKEAFDRFKSQSNQKSVHQSNGVESAMVRAIFSAWYAKDLWGEPSAQALASFIEHSNVIENEHPKG